MMRKEVVRIIRLDVKRQDAAALRGVPGAQKWAQRGRVLLALAPSLNLQELYACRPCTIPGLTTALDRWRRSIGAPMPPVPTNANAYPNLTKALRALHSTYEVT